MHFILKVHNDFHALSYTLSNNLSVTYGFWFDKTNRFSKEVPGRTSLEVKMRIEGDSADFFLSFMAGQRNLQN